MKYLLVGLSAIVACYFYGRHLRLKKNKIKKQSSNVKFTYDLEKFQEFKLEDLLVWYKSHTDVVDSDEYILCRTNHLKKIGLYDDFTSINPDNLLVMIIFDSITKQIKHLRVVSYIDVDEDILTLLDKKDFVILE